MVVAGVGASLGNGDSLCNGYRVYFGIVKCSGTREQWWQYHECAKHHGIVHIKMASLILSEHSLHGIFRKPLSLPTPAQATR